MNAWLKKELVKQYERAEKLGWIKFFVEAEEKHTKNFFDAADLMGIGSRETNLDPKWLTKAGDSGNGFGLMQADKRSFPEFTKGDGWKDAKTGIDFGAKVLMQKWTDVQECIGKKRSVRSSKTGNLSYFTGKNVRQSGEAQQVTIASYNAGRWAHYAVSKGKNADTYTTGKDYSSDVLQRAAFFRPLIEEWKNENLPKKEKIAEQKTASEPTTQIADQITNIEAEKSVPDNFVPETKPQEAPPKENSIENAGKFTVLGFAVPSFLIAIFTAIKNAVNEGFINVSDVLGKLVSFIADNTHYLFWLIGLVILLLIIKKVFKQITFWIQMLINANPNWHDVQVVPSNKIQDKSKWYEVWK